MITKSFQSGEDERGYAEYEDYYVYESPVYIHPGEGLECCYPNARNLTDNIRWGHQASRPIFRDQWGQYVWKCPRCGVWNKSDALPYGAFSVILRKGLDKWHVSLKVYMPF